MSKFLVGTAVAVVAIYGAYEYWPRSGPDLKVWVKQTHIPPNNDPYDLLIVQSREEKPIVLKGIVMNNNPKCINMEVTTYKPGTSVKLGEVYQFALGIHGFNACEPVKVVITTDRGEATYRFNE